jgi:type I restriction enzyme M protein
MVAEQIKKKVHELKQDSLKEIKQWFEQQLKSISYYHRHYIVDNEYIPFDRTQEDKKAFINAFLAKEIDYQIITWKEYDQLGYEILPNKYFYKYQEPTPSDDLIKEFWKLEEDAEKLLNEIRNL